MNLIDEKYEVLHQLSEGGMGTIYKVRHRLLDEIRVVKVMRSQAATNQGLRKRFIAEARMAIKVRHTNIGQLYDFTIDDEGNAVIVMEFIDGVTVQEILGSGPVPSLSFVIDIAVQTLQALSCLHFNDIVHRDVASDNVMITRTFDGKPLVKVIDLGIAKDPAGDGTATGLGTFMGKARYAAPEQFDEDYSKGPRPSMDIYSFGVLLYEMLTGRLPVNGTSFPQLAAGHLFEPPVPFAESDPDGRVPEELREIVLAALEKDPGRRISGAEELAKRIEAFRGESGSDPGELDQLLARVRAGRPAPPTPSPEPDRWRAPIVDTILDAVLTPWLLAGEIETLGVLWNRHHRAPATRATVTSGTDSPTIAVPAESRPAPVPRQASSPPAAVPLSVPPPSEPAPEVDAEEEEYYTEERPPRRRTDRRRRARADARRPRTRRRREPRNRSWVTWIGVVALVFGLGGYAIWMSLRDPFADKIAEIEALPMNTTMAIELRVDRIDALLNLMDEDHRRRSEFEREHQELTELYLLHQATDRLSDLAKKASAPDLDADQASRDASDAENLWNLIIQYRAAFPSDNTHASRIEDKARSVLEQIAETTESEQLRALAARP